MDNLYTEPKYQNINENENVDNKNGDVSVDEIISSYITKNKEMSNNLTNQREIIKNQYQLNKELDNELKSLKQENELLKKQINDFKQTNLDNGYENRISELENTINSLKEKEYHQQLKPVIEYFLNSGVKSNELDFYFDKIKENFSVDLKNNPNLNLAKNLLDSLLETQEPNHLPNGYVSDNVQSSFVNDTSYQEKIKARQDEFLRQLNKNKK